MKGLWTQGRVYRLGVMLAAGSVGLSACTCLTHGHSDFDMGIKQRGRASWYGEYFHGLRTANGEIYDMHAMTAAHRTLPLGTVVTVFNVANGRHVVVRINDRGPYKKGRILDLSYGAARELHMVDQGVAPVHLQVVGDRKPVLRGSDSEREAISAPTEGGRPSNQALHAYEREKLAVWSGRRHGTVMPTRFRPRPADLLRAPRMRRVADTLEAEHHVYCSATGLVIA